MEGLLMLHLHGMAIGDNIRRMRREREFSQEYVAEKLGLTQAQISRIENNESDPDSELISKFAEVLGVSPGILFEQPAVRPKEGKQRLDISGGLRPVYGSVPAGSGSVREEPSMYEDAPPGVQDGGKGYWLRVKGDSMHPALRDGQLVFVNPEREVHDNDFVVVVWNDHTDGAIKQVHFTTKEVILSSINQIHPPIVVPREKISLIARICYVKL